MPSFAVLMVCHRYWRRFASCWQTWREALDAAPDVDCRLLVATIGQPPDLPTDNRLRFIDVQGVCMPSPSATIESKGRMLMALFQAACNASHWVFTDADILIPPDAAGLLQQAVGSHPYVVADRRDLPARETISVLGGLADPWTMDFPPPTPKKRGMGWFQCAEAARCMQVAVECRWAMHEGYDLIDWQLNDRLTAEYGQHVLETGLPFLHLWHGDDGANWQGAHGDF